MFGFLHPSAQCGASNLPNAYRTYRQVYATQCRAQNKIFGRLSLVFLSYEAIFLHLLAIDLGVANPPKEDSALCCKTLGPCLPTQESDRKIAEYCAAAGMLLGQTKLQDDVHDDRSLAARLGLWILGSRMEKARRFFEATSPGFTERIETAINDHIAIEKSAARPSLSAYVAPTANAFSILFSGLADLDTRFDRSLLASIGSDIGTAIIAFDCATDWKRDKQRGTYNPLRTKKDTVDAMHLASQAIVSAGFSCDRQTSNATTVWLLRGVANRVGAWEPVESREGGPPPSTAKRRTIPKRLLSRAGICDCDVCCVGCELGEACGSGCSACEAGCFACDCASCYCHECGNHSRKGNSNAKAGGTNESESLVGKTAVASVPLRPSGMVELNGKTYPARTESGYVEQDTQVIVMGETQFGLIVSVPNQQ